MPVTGSGQPLKYHNEMNEFLSTLWRSPDPKTHKKKHINSCSLRATRPNNFIRLLDNIPPKKTPKTEQYTQNCACSPSLFSAFNLFSKKSCSTVLCFMLAKHTWHPGIATLHSPCPSNPSNGRLRSKSPLASPKAPSLFRSKDFDGSSPGGGCRRWDVPWRCLTPRNRFSHEFFQM